MAGEARQTLRSTNLTSGNGVEDRLRQLLETESDPLPAQAGKNLWWTPEWQDTAAVILW